MQAIELTDVSKQFKNFSINNLHLRVPTGSIVGLVGENGAGKSTTLHMIMQALKKDSGTIYVLGVNNEADEFLDVKQKVGVVLDEAYFPETLTAKRIQVVLRNVYTAWDDDAFDYYMEQFKLPYNQVFKDFSRGMKMKLQLAVALSHHAELLILDEATSGLDPMVREEILDIINEFTRDERHTVLLSSHIVSDLEKSCDYIAFLHQGRLKFMEEKDGLLERFRLLKIAPEEINDLTINQAAIKGQRVSRYAVELLVDKAALSSSDTVFGDLEKATLEDVMILMTKGVKQL
ncbi:ABC-2 type transport system ATP-binding protein [Halolactibacillus halophilus]|uniref:ABC transporter n=1 Tax=Halolactibacillus halophilus TaxID=306540 RepID=A0A1I5SRP8_9BACI|nr:ABC transporter ATP-binding protein [Halolactibacillus halophilus]GEM02673.1 ABC transporter [Halolactibacillus halophilus]SFP73311.1 ABC-2 type transport system ATP-binding protein [Halolactibacillus halophilus]